MRGSLFRKNVIKDYFERTYATALVMIAFLLFLDAMLFIISRGVVQSGEGAEYLVKNFSFMGGNFFMAVAFPAIMLWMFLGGFFDRGAGDLYQSLPPTRNEMFSGAVCVITGYEGVFLLLQMLLRLLLIAVTKGFHVRKYFYTSVIGFTLAVYLVFLGIALLCFCASAGTFGFFGRIALWAAILWTMRSGISLLFFVKQMLYLGREFNVSGTLVNKLENTWGFISERFLFDDIEVDTYVSAWELGTARDVGLFLAVFGLVLLLVAWLWFRKRPAERTDGRNRSEVMHVCLQTAAFGSILMNGLGLLNDYEYHRIRAMLENSGRMKTALVVLKKAVLSKEGLFAGISALIFFCVWEALYRKSIREIWKVWKGILLGTLFGTVCAVFALVTL